MNQAATIDALEMNAARETAGMQVRPASVIIASINRAQGDTGVHTHTRILAEGFARQGVRCELVSPFSGTKKWLPVFAVRPLLLKHINKTWSTRWHRHWHRRALEENLLRRLSGSTVDVVLAQCPVSARAALDARRKLGARFDVAMVCHFNGSEAEEYRDKGELNDVASFGAVIDFESRVLRAVDRIIYVSSWARHNVESGRGLSTPSSVVWNGIPDSQCESVDRRSIGLGADDLVLINVGSLEPRKNQLGLIDLFVRIHAEHAAVKLVLVGDGPDRSAIENKLRQTGLTEHVRMLGIRRDVPALLAAADIYVHYASLENCPIVLLEAARAGLPSAAIPAGGVPELQQKLAGSVALHASDIEQSLQALRPLLSSAETRRELGQKARDGFQQCFTQDAMVQSYIDALGLNRSRA